jgi:hypothetical protein
MTIATDLNALVEEFAIQLEHHLQLTGNEQEEFSTVLGRLEAQADRSEPNEAIAEECLKYLSRWK